MLVKNILKRNCGKELYRIDLEQLHSFIFLKSEHMFYSLYFIKTKIPLLEGPSRLSSEFQPPPKYLRHQRIGFGFSSKSR